MDDKDLIAAMHNLGSDLTDMASKLADRRGFSSYADAMVEAREKLGEAYAKIITKEQSK